MTFIADRVIYDRARGLVTAEGHVQAWQNDHVLLADKIVFDRNTNVVAATGHVSLIEPDGQVLSSQYAELTQGMRDAVLRGMGAILAENGKLVANGARRTGGEINEMSQAVYSTCNLCAKHPEEAPLWELRAATATQDVEHKRIEYRNVWLDIYGVPVAYFPYFWHADPSVKRASGFLVPSFGSSKHIGAFASVPYYWVLDGQSDLTITPTLGTQAQALELKYRRRFNDGVMSIDGSLAHDEGSAQADIFANGQFNLNDTWRYGFDIERASSADYLRDFRIKNISPNVLTSQVYLEGFGDGAYSRLDARAYQALNVSVTQNLLPTVLPRYEYSFFGKPDPLGGRFSLDFSAFNVLRDVGTNTQRVAARMNWERPFTGALGDLWKLILHVDTAAYVANQFDQQPNFAPESSTETARALPTAGVKLNWPFVRDAGSLGTQLIEPIAQILVSPNVGASQNLKYPNEDSLGFDFSDANLFAINRFNGLDRLEGGTRGRGRDARRLVFRRLDARRAGGTVLPRAEGGGHLPAEVRAERHGLGRGGAASATRRQAGSMSPAAGASTTQFQRQCRRRGGNRRPSDLPPQRRLHLQQRRSLLSLPGSGAAASVVFRAARRDQPRRLDPDRAVEAFGLCAARPDARPDGARRVFAARSRTSASSSTSAPIAATPTSTATAAPRPSCSPSPSRPWDRSASTPSDDTRLAPCASPCSGPRSRRCCSPHPPARPLRARCSRPERQHRGRGQRRCDHAAGHRRTRAAVRALDRNSADAGRARAAASANPAPAHRREAATAGDREAQDRRLGRRDRRGDRGYRAAQQHAARRAEGAAGGAGRDVAHAGR